MNISKCAFPWCPEGLCTEARGGGALCEVGDAFSVGMSSILILRHPPSAGGGLLCGSVSGHSSPVSSSWVWPVRNPGCREQLEARGGEQGRPLIPESPLQVTRAASSEGQAPSHFAQPLLSPGSRNLSLPSPSSWPHHPRGLHYDGSHTFNHISSIKHSSNPPVGVYFLFYVGTLANKPVFYLADKGHL